MASSPDAGEATAHPVRRHRGDRSMSSGSKHFPAAGQQDARRRFRRDRRRLARPMPRSRSAARRHGDAGGAARRPAATGYDRRQHPGVSSNRRRRSFGRGARRRSTARRSRRSSSIASGERTDRQSSRRCARRRARARSRRARRRRRRGSDRQSLDPDFALPIAQAARARQLIVVLDGDQPTA